MRLFLLLAFVAAVYASRLEETYYKPGHEYHYVYEGQTLTGFPGASKHYSGLKVKCVVKVKFVEQEKCLMQMDSCEVGQLNKRLPSTQIPERQIPIRQFEPVEREDLHLIQSELSKPVEFRYSRGEVHQFSYSSEEPEWSVDVKRAVVQIFQLNLNKQNVPYAAEHLISNNHVIRDWNQQQQQTFTVSEDSISGVCEQIYTVNSLPIYEQYSVIQPQVPVMNITKVKNFTTCEHFPLLINSTLNLHNCTDCRSEKTQPLQSYAHTRYNCTGNRQQFIIESAETEGRHIFTPYQEKNGEMTTYVRQSLKLLQTMPIRSQIPQPRSSMKQSSLRLKSLDESNHGEPDYEQKRQVYIVRKVLTILEAMKEDVNQQVISSEAPSNVIHLIAHLRHAKPHEVEEIYEQLKQHRQQQTLLKLFLDALPVLGSPISVKIIKEEMNRERLSIPHAVQILTQLSYTCNKEVDTVDEMMHLCMEPKVQRNTQLKTACWLSFGNMVHETCQKSNEVQHYHQSKCSSDKQEKYRKVLAQGITSRKQTEQFICLSAIGNAGLEKSAQDLFYVIKDSSRPIEIRLNALYALQRIAHKMPRQVEEFLLPMFMNIEEHYELRIGAVNVIMSECRPHQEIVQIVSQQLSREPNLQVGSYVYSLLNTIANTTQPCYKRLAQNVQEVLRFSRPIRPGFHYSKTQHLPLIPKQFREQLRMSPTVQMQMIGSNHTLFSGVMHANVRTSFMSKIIDLFGVGVRAQGLQNIFNWLQESGTEELQQYFKYHPRNFDTVLKEMMQLKDNLQIENRIREDPSLSIWFELFGSKLNVFNLNKETVQEIFNYNEIQQKLRELERKIYEGIDLSFSKSLPLMYSDHVIPTEMGLPVRMHVASAVVVKNTGFVKVQKVESSRRNFLPSQVTFEMDLNPSFATHIVGNMSVKLATVESGSSIKAKAKLYYPLSGKFTVDLRRMTLVKEFQPKNRNVEVLNVQVKPLTFTRKSPFTKFTSNSPVVPILINEKFEEQTVHGVDIFKPQMEVYRYPCPILGTEYVLQTLMVPRVPGSPFHPITGKQQVKIYLRQNQQQIDKVELKLKYQSNINEYPFWNSQEMSNQEQYEPTEQHSWYESYIPNLFSSSRQQEYRYQRNPLSSIEDISNLFTSIEQEEQPSQRRLPLSRETQEEEEEEEEEWNERQETPIYSNKHKKHALTLQVVSKSQDREVEKATSLLTWSSSQDYTKNKMQLKVVKTQQGHHQKLFEVESQIEYPELSRRYTSWSELVSSLMQQQESILTQTHITWGEQGQRQIKIKSITEKSPEQYREQQSQSYKNKPEYIQCEKDQVRGNKHSPACRQIQKYLRQHRQVKIQVEYEQMPNYLVNTTNKLYRLVKSMLYPYADVNDVVNTPNKINLVVRLMNNSHVVNAYLYTPKQITHFTHVPLPFTLEPMARAPTSNLYQQYISYFSDNKYNPKCRVVDNKMQTFDQVELPFPNNECYYLLTSDCSQRQEYQVMAAEHQQTQLKKVKIYSNDKKIEIVPESEQKMNVYVNEQRVQIHPGHKLYVGAHQQPIYEQLLRPQPEKCTIYCLTPTEYKVECEQSGVRVRTDGRNIEVKVSEMKYSRGIQCGLCGDFNGEQIRELTGPTGEQYSSIRRFIRSYQVPSQQCSGNEDLDLEPHTSQEYFNQLPEEQYERYNPTSSEVYENYFPSSSEQYNSQEYESSYSRYTPTSEELEEQGYSNPNEQGQEPVYMTRVERSEKWGQELICFSNKPVKTCPEQTEPVQTRQRRVSFHCLPKYSEESRALLEQAERFPVSSLEYKSKDETLVVPEDIVCTPRASPYSVPY